MQRKEHIDIQVKKALDSTKPAYREDLWKGIEQQLPAKRNPFVLYWRGIAAILLLTAGSAGVYYMNSGQQNHLDNQAVVSVIEDNSQTSPVNKTLAEGGENSEKANTTANPYKQGRENASVQNININNSTKQIRKSIAGNPTGNSNNFEENNLVEQSITSSFSGEVNNTFHSEEEEELENIQLAVNEVNNETETKLAGRYSNKLSGRNETKKRQPEARQNNKITTYAFWQNAAYTGEQGKLNLSFDDKISYLQGESYSACQNNFGAEYAIPKSRFAVGLYHQRFLKQFSLKTTTGLTASARLFTLGNGYFKAGAGLTYLSSKLFKNNLNYSDQIDAKAGFINTSRERNFTSVQNTVGADAGIWYSSPRLIAGISAKNINQPQFGRIEEGERLRREWQAAAGYSIPVNNITIMPWAEARSTAVTSQASSMLLVSYKDVFTLGAGYMNISPLTLRGDVMVQAQVEIKNRLRVYGMYGQNMEMKSVGLQQNIIQTGLRYQVQ